MCIYSIISKHLKTHNHTHTYTRINTNDSLQKGNWNIKKSQEELKENYLDRVFYVV